MMKQKFTVTESADTPMEEVRVVNTMGVLPAYWPSARIKIHEEEASPNVHRVSTTLFAPGLPPGEYEMYLPPTDAAGHPEWKMYTPNEMLEYGKACAREAVAKVVQYRDLSPDGTLTIANHA